ncbi:hypothetical protein PMAYCL1PPCAC_20042, partial [Pristionchus mayeri]
PSRVRGSVRCRLRETLAGGEIGDCVFRHFASHVHPWIRPKQIRRRPRVEDGQGWLDRGQEAEARKEEALGARPAAVHSLHHGEGELGDVVRHWDSG